MNNEITLNSTLSLEESALYNPSYIGYLVYSFVCEYIKVSNKSVSSNLIYLSIPLALNKNYLRCFPKTTKTTLEVWSSQNEGVLLSLPIYAKGCVSIVTQAIEFLYLMRLIVIDEKGYITLGNNRLPQTSKLVTSSINMKSSQRASVFLGRWFAGRKNEKLIFMIFGVKP